MLLLFFSLKKNTPCLSQKKTLKKKKTTVVVSIMYGEIIFSITLLNFFVIGKYSNPKL